MANYKEMYITLFRETAKAIELLQKAQQSVEEMYISAVEPEIRLIDMPKPTDDIAEIALQKK